MSKALVLFDVDGCTSVVESSKLDVATQGAVTICNHGGQRLIVEILKLSDYMRVLDRYEDVWSQSERACALDIHKENRVDEEGGFLTLGLEAMQDDHEEQVTEQDQQVAATQQDQQVAVTQQDEQVAAPQQVCQQVAAPQQVAGITELDQQVVEPGENRERREELLGLKNRKVIVCAQGSGDYSREFAIPKRQPFHTEHLKRDQTELLLLQVAEFANNKRSFGTQTDPVIVVDNVLEILNSFQCGKCPTIERKLDAVLDSLSDLKGSVEKSEASLSESFLNSVIGQTTPVVVEDLQVVEDAQQSEEEVFTYVLEEEAEYMDVEKENVVNYLPDTVKSISYNEHVNYSRQCFPGPIGEIRDYDEYCRVSVEEMRVNLDTQLSTKAAACSVGNFGWLLVRKLYSEDELIGKNYNGKRGKNQLSPRRLHAIEHAAADMFGEAASKRLLSNAINASIRSMKQRVPLQMKFL